jgi:hypothetical protein
MPIDPTDLANSIGALGGLDPQSTGSFILSSF